MPIFYRVVLTRPPSEFDLRSDRERGYAKPTDPTRADEWDGISVFATESQARRKAPIALARGTFIAAIDVSEGGPIRYERRGKTKGHYILWGDARVMLDHVVSVVPMTSDEE